MKNLITFYMVTFILIQMGYAQNFDFSIYSQYGNTKPTSDARSIDHEKQILQTVLKDTYDHITPDLREVADEITYVVDHESDFTKTVMGFSAEDDKSYKYPDKTFYHPFTNRNGTIRIIFTEKFVQTCDFLLELIEQNSDKPKIIHAAQEFYRSIIEHELVHAHQYHTKPVPDLDRNMNFVDHGEITLDQLIQATREKVNNERIAYNITMTHAEPGRLEILAEATESYMKQNPDDFVTGGKYSLLNNSMKFPFINRYLREADTNTIYYFANNKKPPKTWMMIYEGQIRPVEIALEMKKVVNQKTKLSKRERKTLASLFSELTSFENDPFWNDVTLHQHSYLADYINQAHVIFTNLPK